MTKFLILLCAILLTNVGFAQRAPINRSVTDLSPAPLGEVIKHTFYTIAYSEQDEQPYWVYYVLTPGFLAGDQVRKDEFRRDPSVKTGSASLEDYAGSGYDRGHLCPAGDMVFNKTAMSESFYLSNMSPQEPSFNRGVWKKLETQVREWAKYSDSTYVVTGGVLRGNMQHIGPDRVAVPKYYYKAVYCPSRGMIGFLLPNEGSSKSINEFVVPVDSIEALTGLDFYRNLPDNRERLLEASVNFQKWGMTSMKTTTASSGVKKADNVVEGVQCAGVTKSGTRCKRAAEKGSKYCWQHQP